jgi:hypothetical protein
VEDSGVTAAGAHDANRRISRLRLEKKQVFIEVLRIIFPFLFFIQNIFIMQILREY